MSPPITACAIGARNSDPEWYAVGEDAESP